MADNHSHEWVPTYIGFDGVYGYFFIKYVCGADDDCEESFLDYVEAEEM